MRFRAGLLLFVFTLILGIACRKPLTPNIDRNQAPETWIVGAPQDTVSSKDDEGNPIVTVGQIASRFHLYWAGSDADGAIAGFYFAVVETLPNIPAGFRRPPPLPGPKPGDYHFTRKSDSVFVFRVSTIADDREHAFYVYAVDN